MLEVLEKEGLIAKSLSNILYEIKEVGNAGAHASAEGWGMNQNKLDSFSN